MKLFEYISQLIYRPTYDIKYITYKSIIMKKYKTMRIDNKWTIDRWI